MLDIPNFLIFSESFKRSASIFLSTVRPLRLPLCLSAAKMKESLKKYWVDISKVKIILLVSTLLVIIMSWCMWDFVMLSYMNLGRLRSLVRSLKEEVKLLWAYMMLHLYLCLQPHLIIIFLAKGKFTKWMAVVPALMMILLEQIIYFCKKKMVWGTDWMILPSSIWYKEFVILTSVEKCVHPGILCHVVTCFRYCVSTIVS